MRLLNAESMLLEEFFDEDVPPYAILSHRWQDEEVSLQDMQDIQNGKAKQKAGYLKMKHCCQQALKDGLKYAWIDTCCIDKTSSADLSESINSMFRWYQNSEVCYAYLFDLEDVSEALVRSKWFTRGWTLQELIAPPRLIFYTSTWHYLGTKEDLRYGISVITGIDVEVLMGANLETFSVAKRMSWASKRTTTRVEDVAYSLLGIFDVNMPMLYGEGERAFIRLQEEIMKHSDDHSIFAWSCNDDGPRGLLANSPAMFENCRDITPARKSLDGRERLPYSVTNMGLEIELLLLPWTMNTYLAALDCQVADEIDISIGIFLCLPPEPELCYRVKIDGRDTQKIEPRWILNAKSNTKLGSFYKKVRIRQKVWASKPTLKWMYGFWIRTMHPGLNISDSENLTTSLASVTAYQGWNNETRFLEIPAGSSGTAGILWFVTSDGTKWGARGREFSTFKLGFDNMFNPVCMCAGPIWHLDTRLKHPDSEPQVYADKLDAQWITINEAGIYKGDRNNGLKIRIGQDFLVSIVEEVVRNQRMWVVDITLSNVYTCKGCNERILLGTYYSCVTCSDFEYCKICYFRRPEPLKQSTGRLGHREHVFQKDELNEHGEEVVYRCGACGIIISGLRYDCNTFQMIHYCPDCFEKWSPPSGKANQETRYIQDPLQYK